MQQGHMNAQLLAYEKIRDQILNGTLAGGTKLVEERLAEEIGVSRTPIREAIRRLEQEGLIQKKRVFKPSRTDLIHLFEMRILIECFAVKKAAKYMTEEELIQLKETIVRARNSKEAEVVAANKEFHDMLVKQSRNPLMIANLDKMKAVIYLFSKAVVFNKRPMLIDEHEDIYHAIAARDGERASQLMEQHLQSDLQFTLDLHVLD
ncbi:GntR family transcriptional regulator [Metasolibacillus meyeri]|uniref:GntR family transcriptional regulator n=1 Tax=Metasolibacillus meyeri TaxID=1071052 RepID=A0AAW9NNT1_9BACL|nr:GntR family transcriptional regulator [Metasolibacillus meyeri]MEC1178176.1 GntR family transcriptional regulator [Metasolibacillus meyeri]